MLNNEQVIAAFAPLIGFRRGDDSNDAELDADVCSSTTSTYVDGLHALLTTQNLEATAKSMNAFTEPRSWDNATSYVRNDIVVHAGKKYYAKTANVNKQPSTNPNDWGVTNVFSHYLRKKREASIVNLLNNVRAQSKLMGAREVLQDAPMFYGIGRHYQQKYGRFVGLVLTVQGKDLALKIPRIILQFSKAQTIPVYVFHSSSAEPIHEYQLEYTQAKRQQTFILETPLALSSIAEYEGGYYTIGYFESDLDEDNQAIYSDEFKTLKCSSCNDRSAQAYARWSPYVSIDSVQVDEGFIEDKPNQTWVEDDIVQVVGQNWGLNLVFSVACDLTSSYIYNKESFTQALGAQLKLDLLTSIAHSTRGNQINDTARNQAWAELKSDQNPYKELQKEIAALKIDLSNLNPICQPCVDKKISFKWGSVW